MAKIDPQTGLIEGTTDSKPSTGNAVEDALLSKRSVGSVGSTGQYATVST